MHVCEFHFAITDIKIYPFSGRKKLKDEVVLSVFKHKDTKQPKRKSPRKHVCKEESQKVSPTKVTDEEVILDSNDQLMDLGRGGILGVCKFQRYCFDCSVKTNEVENLTQKFYTFQRE